MWIQQPCENRSAPNDRWDGHHLLALTNHCMIVLPHATARRHVNRPSLTAGFKLLVFVFLEAVPWLNG